MILQDALYVVIPIIESLDRLNARLELGINVTVMHPG